MEYSSNSTSIHNTSMPLHGVQWDISKAPLRKIRFECSFLSRIRFPNGSHHSFLESIEEQNEVEEMCDFRSAMVQVFFWSAVGLGIPGNVAAFATLITMPKTTCTLFIALLSIVDLASIVLKGSMTFFNKFGVPLGDVMCKILVMLVNFSVCYANWVLVLICLERFITVRFPLKKPIYFTTKRARYCAIALACNLIPVVAIHLVTHEEAPAAYPQSCRTRRSFVDLGRKWKWVTAAFYSYIPATLLFFFVGLIIAALRHHRKEREALSEGQEESICMRDVNPANTTTSRINEYTARQWSQFNKLERSITGMLVVAGVVFLILTVPICTVMLVQPYLKTDTPASYARLKIVYSLVRGLAFLSHAVNCYIYFMACKRFRRHLLTRLAYACRRIHTPFRTSEVRGGQPFTQTTRNAI